MVHEKCSTCGEYDTFEFAPEWDVEGYLYYRCSCCGNLKSHKIRLLSEWEENNLQAFIATLIKERGELE